MMTGGTLLRLGDLQRRMARYDDADRSLSEAISILKAPRSGQYAQALQFHGDLARTQGHFDLAVERYRGSLDAFRASVGDGIYTWLTELKLVEGLIDAGRLDEADPIASEAVTALSRVSGDNGYDQAYSSSVMGALRRAQGRDTEAAELYRTHLELITKIYGDAHSEVAQARVALAGCLIALREEAGRREAAVLLETAKAVLEAPAASDESSTGRALGALYLERATLRRDTGDAAGARSDVADAILRLQAPADARVLKRAQTLARTLDVRA
jgi:serine/threonine-protein kinase